MSKTEIIKVQRPLSTNDLGSPWLLYDQKRAHVEHRLEASIDEQVKAAMGTAPKGYFGAEWTGKEWKIGAKVPAENW